MRPVLVGPAIVTLALVRIDQSGRDLGRRSSAIPWRAPGRCAALGAIHRQIAANGGSRSVEAYEPVRRCSGADRLRRRACRGRRSISIADD